MPVSLYFTCDSANGKCRSYFSFSSPRRETQAPGEIHFCRSRKTQIIRIVYNFHSIGIAENDSVICFCMIHLHLIFLPPVFHLYSIEMDLSFDSKENVLKISACLLLSSMKKTEGGTDFRNSLYSTAFAASAKIIYTPTFYSR